MNKRLLIFLLIYYTVLLLLFAAATRDASASLGYGYFMVIWCGVAFLVLVVLSVARKIVIRNLWDGVAFVFASPVGPMLIGWILSILLIQ